MPRQNPSLKLNRTHLALTCHGRIEAVGNRAHRLGLARAHVLAKPNIYISFKPIYWSNRLTKFFSLKKWTIKLTKRSLRRRLYRHLHPYIYMMTKLHMPNASWCRPFQGSSCMHRNVCRCHYRLASCLDFNDIKIRHYKSTIVGDNA